MAEPKYTIYSTANKTVAWSKLGVMWVGKCEERLGEFYKNGIFDCAQEQIAYVKGDTVFSMEHKTLGKVKPSSYVSDNGGNFEATALVVNGLEVAKCFPKNTEVALAGVVLLRDRLE